jgi:hypothetical protein
VDPEVLAHRGVEADRRIADGHQGMAVGAQLQAQEPGDREQD